MPNSMKALVKKFPEKGLWLDTVPFPILKSNEVLIKVLKTSICGTDVHIYKWDAWAQKTVPTPMVIGHEFVGIIDKVGRDVHHLKPGMRVTAEGHITCGICAGCRHGKRHLCVNVEGLGYDRTGCFSEYFALPASNVFILPDNIPDHIAGIFDPFGNAVHTALSLELVGESVMIAGAGPIGIMAAAIARKAGARHVIVTDINPWRLDLAKNMGATDVINVSETNVMDYLKSIGLHEGITAGMEMSGTAAGLSSLLEAARPGTTIALLGLLPQTTQIDWDLVIFKMLTLKGIYGREIFATWDKMVNLVESGLDLNPVITHHLPFEEFETGFQAMLSGQSGKVILDWSKE